MQQNSSLEVTDKVTDEAGPHKTGRKHGHDLLS